MTQAEQELLQQGINEYLDASNAIKAFRSIVQETCRRVVEQNLDEYAGALGITLSKKDVLEHEYFQSDRAGCSVGVKLKPVVKGLSYAELGCTVAWWAEDGDLKTGIYMWIWSRRKGIERLSDVLRRKGVNPSFYETGDPRYLEVGELITAQDVARMESKFDKVMKKWITLWTKAGGIKVLGE